MGAFPHLSRNVPFCPRLSSFVPICPLSGPQEGQKRTNEDKTGHFGTNGETPSFSIYPHLARLNHWGSRMTFHHFIFREFFGRREMTPTPKTRVSIWTLLRTPGRFTTRPLPVHLTTKLSIVRPFSVLSKDEIGP